MSELLDAALDYAGRGIPVFPCEPGGKRPLGRLVPHGLKEATDAPSVLRGWWTKEPKANIGLVTGVVFDALDVDGAEGLAALTAHLPGADDLDNDETIDGPTSATGGGGWQVYVKPTGLGNRARFIPGCDWRGAGGYVVAPPSVHPSGRRYEWLVWDLTEPISDSPAWLLALLRQPNPRTDTAAECSVSRSRRRVRVCARDKTPGRLLHLMASQPGR